MKYILLALALLFSSPTYSSGLVANDGAGVEVHLQETACKVKGAKELLDNSGIPTKFLKAAVVVYHGEKLEACYVLHNDHVDVVAKKGDTLNPFPVPIDEFKQAKPGTKI